MRAWREAFDVIAQRLPLGHSHNWLAYLLGYGEPLRLANLMKEWSSLLLIRLGESRLSRKVRAYIWLLKALRLRPETFTGQLSKWWMSRDTPISSLLLCC